MIIRTVGQIVDNRPAISVSPDTSVLSSCRLLEEANVGALAVVDAGRLVGILSERDVVRRCVGQERDPTVTEAREIMTPDPQTVPREASLVIAMDLMLRGGFRHLPVEEDGEVFGILSMREIPSQYRLLYERFEAAFTELDDLVANAPPAGSP